MARTPASAVRKPHFFKVLLPGFFERLKIPPAFVKHIEGEIPQRAMILSPLGKMFHVWIQRYAGYLCFGAGWQPFVHAHDLDLGNFLMFGYEGHLVFSVRVFDLSGCQKEYPTMERDPAYHSGISRHISGYRPHDIKEVARRPVTRSYKKDAAQGTRSQPEVNKRSNSTNVNLVSENKASRTSTASDKFSSFQAVITDLGRYAVHVPTAFKEANEMIRTQSQVVLTAPNRRLWTVGLCHSTKNRTTIGRGWKPFAVGNNLRVGDVCTFELVPGRWRNLPILHVHVKRRKT